VPWRSGKCVVWDVTVIDTLAHSYSYLDSSAVSARGAAEIAAARKTEKYRVLANSYEVVPVALETIWVI
jgi:hypothetical protein